MMQNREQESKSSISKAAGASFRRRVVTRSAFFLAFLPAFSKCLFLQVGTGRQARRPESASTPQLSQTQSLALAIHNAPTDEVHRATHAVAIRAFGADKDGAAEVGLAEKLQRTIAQLPPADMAEKLKKFPEALQLATAVGVYYMMMYRTQGFIRTKASRLALADFAHNREEDTKSGRAVVPEPGETTAFLPSSDSRDTDTDIKYYDKHGHEYKVYDKHGREAADDGEKDPCANSSSDSGSEDEECPGIKRAASSPASDTASDEETVSEAGDDAAPPEKKGEVAAPPAGEQDHRNSGEDHQESDHDEDVPRKKMNKVQAAMTVFNAVSIGMRLGCGSTPLQLGMGAARAFATASPLGAVAVVALAATGLAAVAHRTHAAEKVREEYNRIKEIKGIKQKVKEIAKKPGVGPAVKFGAVQGLRQVSPGVSAGLKFASQGLNDFNAWRQCNQLLDELAESAAERAAGDDDDEWKHMQEARKLLREERGKLELEELQQMEGRQHESEDEQEHDHNPKLRRSVLQQGFFAKWRRRSLARWHPDRQRTDENREKATKMFQAVDAALKDVAPPQVKKDQVSDAQAATETPAPRRDKHMDKTQILLAPNGDIDKTKINDFNTKISSKGYQELARATLLEPLGEDADTTVYINNMLQQLINMRP